MVNNYMYTLLAVYWFDYEIEDAPHGQFNVCTSLPHLQY